MATELSARIKNMLVHGQLKDRTVICARFAISEIVKTINIRTDPESQDSFHHVSMTIDRLIEQVNLIRNTEINEDTYIDSINTLLEKMNKLIAITAGEYANYFPDGFVDGIKERVISIDSRGYIGGDIGLFKRLESLIEFIDHNIYNEIGKSVCDRAQIEVSFYPSNVEYLHKMDICTGVKAETRFDRDEENNFVSDIQIFAKSELFDFEDYMYLPYILAHEIICHGYQCILGSTRREEVPSSCEFTEGFVDAGVLVKVKQWLDQEAVRGSGKLCDQDRRICTEFSSAADRLNEKRRSLRGGIAPFRQSGWRLFDRLAVALAGPNEKVPMREQAASLALFLNIDVLGPEDREIVICALEHVADEPRLPVSAAILGAIRRYLRRTESGVQASSSDFVDELVIALAVRD